ncbi:MAG: hypothetical protein ACI3ZX_01225 [Candidatus Aphodosoma sp.]
MISKYNAKLFLTIITVILQACNNTNQSSSASDEIVDPYAGMTLGEIINAKDERYQILSKNDEGFYYINTTDSLFYYDFSAKKDVLVFTSDSTSNVNKISVSIIDLEISDNGDITIVKKTCGKRSPYNDELFCNLIRRARMASYNDSERFFGKDGFIIDVEKSLGGCYWTRYYLVKPMGDGCVDAIVLPSGSDCKTDIVFNPLTIHISCEFDLSKLPSNLRPSFDNRRITSALITNPLLKFYYGAELQIDGTIIQSNEVDFGHIVYNMDKNLFKNKEELKSYIMQYEPEILGELNKGIIEFLINNAKPLQYFYDATKNENECNRMKGKTYYFTAVVNRISEKDEYTGQYSITFGDQQLRNYLGNIYGSSADEKFENLHVPAQLTLKGKFVGEFTPWEYFFEEIEIVR